MISSFQFSTPSLIKIDFKLNDGFIPENGEENHININTEVEISPGPEDNSSVVILKISIGAEDDSTPFYVYAEEGAAFRWDPEKVDEEHSKKLLKQNAPALLLSYLRPTIAMVTSASPFNSYNIPFVNFTESL